MHLYCFVSFCFCTVWEIIHCFHHRLAIIWQINASQPLIPHRSQVWFYFSLTHFESFFQTLGSTMKLIEGQSKTTRGRSKCNQYEIMIASVHLKTPLQVFGCAAPIFQMFVSSMLRARMVPRLFAYICLMTILVLK
jgi:hypothetical protein